MNAHDSERIKGLLEELGLGEAQSPDDADVVVFNTCTIREKPDTKLAAYLGDAAARKREDPGRVIAVGGCYAEAQRERIFELYPGVDVAFGPGLDRPSRRLARRGRRRRRARALRPRRPRVRRRAAEAPRARLPGVGAGLDGLQLDLLVLHRPGRPRPRDVAAAGRDRRRGHAARRARASARSRCSARTSTRGAATSPLDLRGEFGELLRACDAIEGIERIRFTSPHPKDFREPVIAAIAECDAVCEQVHLPLQSGSTRILKAMRRTYSRERYLALVEKLRAAIPDLALGTDIIVGFPGETEDDFQRDARGRRGGRLRQRVHVRLLAARRHRRGDDARPGAARGEDRAHGAARRADPADRARAQRGARRPRRGGARRGPVAHRRVAAARPHAPKHDGQLHGRRAARASSSTS